MTTANKIRAAVAKHFSLDEGLFKPGERRGASGVSNPRQVLAYLLHRSGMTFTEVGAYLGRDRTTVRHAYRKVAEPGKLNTVAQTIQAQL